MANEQNNQTQNKSSQGTENQSSFGTTGATGSLGSTGSTGSTSEKDNLSTGADQSGSTGLTTESAKETARGLYDQAKNTAGQAYGVATQKATEVLEEKKGGLAEGLSGVVETIRQVGDTLRENEGQTPITGKAAEYGDTLAQQIEKVSNYFERNDVRTMVRDVESFARRNPAVFIGTAFALGLLTARFLKASPRNLSSGGSGRAFAANQSTGGASVGNVNRLGTTNDLTTSETDYSLGSAPNPANPS